MSFYPDGGLVDFAGLPVPCFIGLPARFLFDGWPIPASLCGDYSSPDVIGNDWMMMISCANRAIEIKDDIVEIHWNDDDVDEVWESIDTKSNEECE